MPKVVCIFDHWAFYKYRVVVKKEEIGKHFAWYSSSLRTFQQQYLSLMFVDPNSAPDHFAYLCPLCLKNGILAGQSIGLRMSENFSLDHFPPKSVGGHFSILVCKKCNNDAGTVEDELKKMMTKLSFNSKTISSEIESRTTITGIEGNYGSILKINDDGNFEVDFNASGKKYAPQWIQNPGTDWEAKINIKIPDQKKVAKALIKAAYLYCFGTWGYDFTFSFAGERLRKFLNDEDEYPGNVPVAWFGKEIKEKQLMQFPVGVCYILEPANCKSVLVNIVLVNKETDFKEVASILMPGPTFDCWQKLANVQSEIQSVYDNNGQITIGHAKDFLLRDGYFDGFTRTVQKISSEI